MSIDDTRISLEGYRIQVLERLRHCPDSRRARDVLVEVNVTLTASELSAQAQRAFWEALGTDLDVVVEEWTGPVGKRSAAAVETLIADAQADIARYLLVLERKKKTPDSLKQRP